MIIKYGTLREEVSGYVTVQGLRHKYGKMWNIPKYAYAMWHDPKRTNRTNPMKVKDEMAVFSHPSTVIEFFTQAQPLPQPPKPTAGGTVLVDTSTGGDKPLPPGVATC